MNTNSQLLLDPPKEITFNYFPKKYLSSILKLTNVKDYPVAFKVKTNVPAHYVVKPHIGAIPSQCSVEINITMQPTDYNPQNASINDKFLVEAVPVPANIDLSSLSDPTQFQQLWSSTSKSQAQSDKLKVVLKFDSASRTANTSVLDKSTTELDASKDQSREFLSESIRSGVDASDFKSLQGSMINYRDEPNSGGLMMSFGGEIPALNTSKVLSQGQPVVVHAEPSSGSQVIKPVVEEREVIKKTSVPAPVTVTVQREERVVDESNRLNEERIQLLEKRIDDLLSEKKSLNNRYQELTGKGEDQKRLLFELSEENTRLKSELSNLKSSTFQDKAIRSEGANDANVYQLWHVLVAAIIAMILGAFLSTK